MFKFFKKAVAPRAKPARSAPKPDAPRRPSAYSRPGFLDRPPVPEVKEGNDESVWDEWESSHMELDSRIGALSELDALRVRDESPSQLDDPDPFSSVRTRRR